MININIIFEWKSKWQVIKTTKVYLTNKMIVVVEKRARNAIGSLQQKQQ